MFLTPGILEVLLSKISHMKTFTRFIRVLGIALHGKIYFSEVLRKICRLQGAVWPTYFKTDFSRGGAA